MICSCQEFQEQYPNCTSCSHDSKIQVVENNRKYILHNRSGQKVCKVTVDGCLIQSQGKAKCDYIIIVCNTQKQEDSSNRKFFDNVYFVELKGRDFLHAVDQLTQTINDFKSQVNGKLFDRIVLSKVSKPEVIKVDLRW